MEKKIHILNVGQNTFFSFLPPNIKICIKEIHIPTIIIGEPPSWKKFDIQAQKIFYYDWILFSSYNGFLYTTKRFQQLGLLAEVMRTKNIAIVGNETQKKIEQEGFRIKLCSKNLAVLVEKLLHFEMKEKKIWFPRVWGASASSLDIFKKKGATIFTAPAYINLYHHKNMNCMKDTLLKEKIDWLVCSSPSTFRNFLKMIFSIKKKIVVPRIASLGATTTSYIKKKGFSVEITASFPSYLQLVKEIYEADIRL